MQQERPVGKHIAEWTPPAAPAADLTLDGAYVRLEPLSAAAHAALLFPAYVGHDWVWDYLPYGPFHSAAAYHRWVKDMADQPDPHFFAIFDRQAESFGGVASLMRINPAFGSVEVGHVNMAPALQRTRAATETMFLFMQWAFNAGYRRFEWKCDALNLPSRRAAQRLGLSFEGVFRQHAVVKGRNRDTAWFAATDQDWPSLREAFRMWLAPGNFDGDFQQRESLSDLTRLVRVSHDPALT